MLKEVRKPFRAKNILAYPIFGAIIIVFVGLSVAPNKIGQDVTGVAAVVNRQQISLADFRDRVQSLERQYQMRMDQIPANQREEMTRAIRQRALEDLIQFEAMVQEASERGVHVADEEVRDAILEIPAFQEDGRFKRDYYDRFLKERQWSAGQFEAKIRKDLMMRRVQSLFQEALKATSAEKSKDLAVESTKINLDVATFNEEDLKAKIPVSSAEIKAWLAAKENSDKIQKVYNDNPMAYAEPEQVRARHILISVDRSKPGAEADAKKKIEALAEKVKVGDFAKLAQENSDDTATKVKGGDLGYFSKGRMVPEFETAAFGTEVGKISAPVKSDFGFHLIKVEDRKPARNKSFDEVKETLAKGEVAQTKIASTLKGLNDKVAAADEASVRKLTKELGLDWSETGAFTLDASQIPHMADPDRLLEQLLKNKTRKGLLPEIIKAKGQNYIVVVKSFVTDQASPANPMGEMAGSRRFYDAFSGWAKSAIGKADIKRNSTVIMN
ncbi:MAG: SurA N-terminal domain-containing protein [Bdellovibrionales bacterium]